ncbi:MAG: M48 family metallopeptidase [Nostocaceae cyanobacterium]|nr:M48 family metallopeptidase [Nostocaceae cyanobacterium]
MKFYLSKKKWRQSISLLLSFLLGFGTVSGMGLSIPSPASAFPLDELLSPAVRLFQLSNLSTKQKVALGKDIHQQVRRNYTFERNSRTNAYVQRIGKRLVKNSECSRTPFNFYVVRNSSINAFATTGGHVYVHTGLINAADNEDQLASVIAHEIAHICNDDLIDKLKQVQLAQGVASLTGLDRSKLAAVGYKLAVDLPNSRNAEFDADADGLRYLQRAGYNPRAMPAFLKKLLRKRSTPTFLSSHPGTRQRITVLERKIATGK